MTNCYGAPDYKHSAQNCERIRAQDQIFSKDLQTADGLDSLGKPPGPFSRERTNPRSASTGRYPKASAQEYPLRQAMKSDRSLLD